MRACVVLIGFAGWPVFVAFCSDPDSHFIYGEGHADVYVSTRSARLAELSSNESRTQSSIRFYLERLHAQLRGTNLALAHWQRHAVPGLHTHRRVVRFCAHHDRLSARH